MPIIRDVPTCRLIVHSLVTQARTQLVAGHPTGAVLRILLAELDQLVDAMPGSSGPIAR